MARLESRYVCGTCGASSLRWEGQCRSCGDWNTLVETVVERTRRERQAGAALQSLRRASRRSATLDEPTATASRSASARSIASSAAGSSRHRWCCSAASRASASRRSCCRVRRDRARDCGTGASCTPRARSPRRSSGCARLAWASPVPAPRERRSTSCRDQRRAHRRRGRGRPRRRCSIVDSIQTLTDGRSRGPGRLRRPGARAAPRGCRRTPRRTACR